MERKITDEELKKRREHYERVTSAANKFNPIRPINISKKGKPIKTLSQIVSEFPSLDHVFEMDDVIVYMKVGWSDSRYPNAKELRDNAARDLRKLGYIVKSSTWDFTDLSRSIRYQIEATHPNYTFNHMGGWKKVN